MDKVRGSVGDKRVSDLTSLEASHLLQVLRQDFAPSLTLTDVFSSPSWRALHVRATRPSSMLPEAVFDWNEEMNVLAESVSIPSIAKKNSGSGVCVLVGASGWLGSHLLKSLKFKK
jgi:hypothetical protein